MILILSNCLYDYIDNNLPHQNLLNLNPKFLEVFLNLFIDLIYFIKEINYHLTILLIPINLLHFHSIHPLTLHSINAKQIFFLILLLIASLI